MSDQIPRPIEVRKTAGGEWSVRLRHLPDVLATSYGAWSDAIDFAAFEAGRVTRSRAAAADQYWTRCYPDKFQRSAG